MFIRNVIRGGKKFAPLALVMALGAVPMFAAGNSPFAAFVTALEAEATGIWAIMGAGVGLVIGLLGMLLGSHQVKSWATGATIICFCLLSIQGILAWL